MTLPYTNPKKVFYTDSDIFICVHTIIREMNQDNWRPDYVVGITRGGLVPANLFSQYLDIPMETLKVSLRDSDAGPESNLWMAEDAYNGKKILIVDDINDTGATLKWIKQDWQGSCHPDDTDTWNNIWGNSVRMAVMVDNLASEFHDVNYAGREINKAEKPEWIVFPWENWWE